jgi:hypothetical protein
MKKQIKRIFPMATLTVVVTISGLATIILYPQPLFANKLEHGQFTVYSNEKISDDIIPLLNKARTLVAKAEINDPNYRYDIFLSFNTLFDKIDDRVLGPGPAARATDNNITVKVRVDTQGDLFFPTFHKNCQGSLAYLIAHEMTHCLQTKRYGMMKLNPVRPPEMWKLEGYPEYISRQAKVTSKDYSLSDEIDRYVELESKTTDMDFVGGWRM